MAFNSILNAEIVVGKPGKQSLWQKVKDNLDFLFGKAMAMGLANGSFEIDSDGDGVPDSWTRSLYPGGSGGFETTNPEHGAKSYYFTHPGGVGNGGGYLDSDYIECSEVEQESLKHFIRSSVTGIKNIVQIQYYTKVKVFVSSTDLYNATAPDTAAHYKAYNFTPPATARYFKVRLIGGYTDTNVAGSTYFDGVQLDHVIDGSVTQAKLALASVGQGQLKTATASGSISAPSTGGASYALTGGTYSWWTGSGGSTGVAFGGGNTAAGVIGLIAPWGTDTFYVDERYIQASPPYQMGNEMWGHFFYVLRKIGTGEIVGTCEAPDPTWAYHGALWIPDKNDPQRILAAPHPFADYWQKDPSIDGLEVVLIDMRGVDVEAERLITLQNKKKLSTAFSQIIKSGAEKRPSSIGLGDTTFDTKLKMKITGRG